jgi:hypothetical protein
LPISTIAKLAISLKTPAKYDKIENRPTPDMEKHMKKSLFMLATSLLLTGCTPEKDWRTASREPAGLAPDPQTTKEAVLQVYGADAWGWRGWFAIHTWIAAKRSGQDHYIVYDVVGWRQHHGGSVLQTRRDLPDRHWYGEKPVLIKEHRGAGVEALIDAVEAAVASYPWKDEYKVFPGPNSNTFTAWVAREVPQLEIDLPFSAIGSGYAN